MNQAFLHGLSGWFALELIQNLLGQDAHRVSRRHAQELSVVYVLIDEAIREVDVEAGFAKFGNLPLRINASVDLKAAQKGPTESWAIAGDILPV